MTKQLEYKALLKKSVYLIYMLMNMTTTHIHKVIAVYVMFKCKSSSYEEKFGNSNHRISDFDSIGYDIIQVFVIMHTVNML